MSFLPNLPSGFGRDSAYPPMPPRSPGPSPSQSVPPRRVPDGTEGPRPAFMAGVDDDELLEPPPPQPEELRRVASGEMLFAPEAQQTAIMGGHRRMPSGSPVPPHRPPQATRATTNAPAPGHLSASPRHPRVPSSAPRPAAGLPPSAYAPQPVTGAEHTARPAGESTSGQGHVSSLHQPLFPSQAAAADASAPAAAAEERSGLATIHVPLTTVDTLSEQRERAYASANDVDRLRWAVQVLKYVERMRATETQVEDKVLGWVDEAILEVVQAASHPTPRAEALYARGDLLASGAFPSYVAKDLRSAFSDFERSARMGWAPSWFRIGRDYETLGDIARARTAYSRGVQLADVGSMYRLGMAHVLGHLELPSNPAEGVPLLQASADAATVDMPHPAYVYGLLLAGELQDVPVPLTELGGGAAVAREALLPQARYYLQRAAYLNLAVAQYKCGWCFEHAQLSFPFDPLMSVQYYSAASQGGEPDADMALSKWFLCGAEGCFDKNEQLAWTFAERAARHGVPTAEFAMGYYLEVGIGTAVDVEAAVQWYTKAAEQGNTDASERLAALQASQQQALLSRAEHQQHLDKRLYAAHQRARKVSGEREPAASNSELARSRTMVMVEDARRRRAQAAARAGPDGAAPARPPAGRMPPPRPAASRPAAGSGAAARPSGGAGRKGFATFSEMGIQTKHERECVIS